MHKLVLIRHGESTWNLDNRFTGWTDVDLTATGVEQAKECGRLLKAEGYEFDVAYTSVLKRATRTLWHCLDEMDRTWLPVVHSWRLNERHYGALQGLNKADMAGCIFIGFTNVDDDCLFPVDELNRLRRVQPPSGGALEHRPKQHASRSHRHGDQRPVINNKFHVFPS